jgi:hypothetical protein
MRTSAAICFRDLTRECRALVARFGWRAQDGDKSSPHIFGDDAGVRRPQLRACPHHAGPSAGASLLWFSSLIPIRQPSRMPAHLGACAHRRAIDSRTTPKKRSIDQESAIHRATSVGNKQSVASAATSCRARFSAGRCTRRQEPMSRLRSPYADSDHAEPPPATQPEPRSSI